jgi:hypothetical protein
MHAGKTTRVQRAWLSLTYQLQPFSGTPVRLGPRTVITSNHTTLTRSKLYSTVLGVSLTWSRAEQTKRLVL